MTPSVRLEVLARFSADARVWRSFDHLVAYNGEALLLVPVALARGNLLSVWDGLPVPWEEVLAVLNADGDDPHPASVETLAAMNPLLVRCFTPGGWVIDRVPAGPKVPQLVRAVSQDGIRWARAKGTRSRHTLHFSAPF